MRVLGVHAGPLMYTRIFLRLEPLGLELVAAAARQAGHEVALIDLQVETHDDFFGWVDRWCPDLILLSCNYLANVPEVVDLAKASKSRRPRAVVCVGPQVVVNTPMRMKAAEPASGNTRRLIRSRIPLLRLPVNRVLDYRRQPRWSSASRLTRAR
jgi:hypothetical protein